MNFFLKLFIPRPYRIRHEILEFLSQNWNLEKYESQRTLNVSKKSVFERFKDIDPSELNSHLKILEKNEEIFFEVGVDGELACHSIYKGLDLYLTQEYIVKGRQERFNNLYDIGKNVLVFLAIVGFFRTVYWDVQNKTTIENMEQRLNSLEKQIPTYSGANNLQLNAKKCNHTPLLDYQTKELTDTPSLSKLNH